MPLPRATSASVTPAAATVASSSRQIVSTSSTLPGAQPAYTPNRPASAYCEVYEYTEYARPRCSRICWNSRLDIPPPSTLFSTPSANRRSSWRGQPGAAEHEVRLLGVLVAAR